MNFTYSPAGFKNLFSRGFPFLPVWDDTKIYFKWDSVFYDGYMYQSKIDNNTLPPTNNLAWEITAENPQNYVSDTDIERAFAEAKINFNADFFTTPSDAEMVFYYLTAHYLVIDLNNALNGLAVGFSGITSSKSVGSVSESYALPQDIVNNPILSPYLQTGYGRKYLSLILPYLRGNIIFCKGRTTYE